MTCLRTAATRLGSLRGIVLSSSLSVQRLSYLHAHQERDVESLTCLMYKYSSGENRSRFGNVIASHNFFNGKGDSSMVNRLSSSQKHCFARHITDIITSLHSSVFQTRKLWTSMPVQMGRRSCKIAARKGAQTAKRGKLYMKFGKQIVSAIKRGGTNPESNTKLAALLQFAKDFDVPMEIVERNIKKASDKNQQDYEEITYEVYGFGGVGIVVEVLTDNLHRAAAFVRDSVKKCGGKMADPGSVLFKFRRVGVISVKADNVDGDTLLSAAMDAGAEDVIEPNFDEDEDPKITTDKYYRVITPSDQYSSVIKKLQAEGIPVDGECSGLELVPTSTFEVDDETIELNKALVEKLLELDDVDAVYSNQA